MLAVSGFASDVGFGACRSLGHAVGCTACGAIGTAGSFAAGRCASSGNIDGRQAAKAGRIVAAGTHATSEITHYSATPFILEYL